MEIARRECHNNREGLGNVRQKFDNVRQQFDKLDEEFDNFHQHLENCYLETQLRMFVIGPLHYINFYLIQKRFTMIFDLASGNLQYHMYLVRRL